MSHTSIPQAPLPTPGHIVAGHNNTLFAMNDNMTQTTDDVDLERPSWLLIAVGFAAGFVNMVTVLGNIMVLLAFVLERAIRRPTNYFIASLAASDLVIGTVSMPTLTLHLMGVWLHVPWLCDFLISVDWSACMASQNAVLFITVDRYLSTNQPIKHRNLLTENNVLLAVAAMWFVPTLTSLISVMEWRYLFGVEMQPEGKCETKLRHNNRFLVSVYVVCFCITIVAIGVLYAHIYRSAVHLKRRYDLKNQMFDLMIKTTGKELDDAEDWEAPVAFRSNQNAFSGVLNPLTDKSSKGNNPRENIRTGNKKTVRISVQSKRRSSQVDRRGLNYQVKESAAPGNGLTSGVIATTGAASSVRIPVGKCSSCDVAILDRSQPGSSSCRLSRSLCKTVEAAAYRERGASESDKSKSVNHAWKALRTITLIFGTHVLCWTPINICFIVMFICQSCLSPDVYYFSYFICYLNSTLNPFCYALAKDEFKRTFLRILRCDCHRT